MQITTLPDNDNLLQQMAELLVVGFREHWQAWESVSEALAEIRQLTG